MPTFEAVNHDPFSPLTQYEPVSHDPWSMTPQFEATDHDPFAIQLPGEPQRQSRGEILSQGLDRLKDFLIPSYLRDTPSSPQADRALADPNAKPGKIGPTSGPPTIAQILGGFAGDAAMSAAPELKATAFLKMLGMANPAPVIAGKPEVIARINELIEQGYGTKSITKELGKLGVNVARSSVRRWLATTGQKTAAGEAAAEGTAHWGPYPEAVDDLRQGINEGKSFEKIAAQIGMNPGNVWQKFKGLQAAGEFPDYARTSFQDLALLKDPEKRADLIRLAKEGTSQGDIASYFFGGPGGKHPRRGVISQFIKQLQSEGELQDYVPQGGTGLTPAGKTPTLPQLKSQAKPAPDEEAGRDFLREWMAYQKKYGT